MTHQSQAAHLDALWNRLSAQHIALGCSCNMGGISVTLEDFERDLADYLWAESERLGQSAATAVLLQPGPLATQDKPVRHLLQRLQEQAVDAEAALWLLERLGRSLESFARLHGPTLEAPLLGGSTAWRQRYREP